jgi:flagellin
MSSTQYKFLIDEMKQLMEELGNTAERVKFNGNYLMGTFKTDSAIAGGRMPFGSVAGNTALAPAAGSVDVDWTFMTGPGDNDKMQILQIPIFASKSHAAALFASASATNPLTQLGALNELYTRVMTLAGVGATGSPAPTSTAAGGPPKQGEGYNVFGTLKLLFNDATGVFSASSSGKTFNTLVDEALLQVNEHRSYFGSFFGRLEHNVANLSALTENLSAALSRVQDTDYGAETSALTRVQILQQAATAMLAQANAMPNVVLGLLKSQ